MSVLGFVLKFNSGVAVANNTPNSRDAKVLVDVVVADSPPYASGYYVIADISVWVQGSFSE